MKTGNNRNARRPDVSISSISEGESDVLSSLDKFRSSSVKALRADNTRGGRGFLRHSDSIRFSNRNMFSQSGASVSTASNRRSNSDHVVGVTMKNNRVRFAQNIWSERVSWTDIQHHKSPLFEKESETKEFLNNVLLTIFLFADLTNEDVGTGGKGKSFGELALMYNCPRTASCVAKSECKLWKIDQKTFRFVMMHSTFNRTTKTVEILKDLAIFYGHHDSFYQKLADVMELKVFKKGEIIIKKGDIGDTFYVITSGTVFVNEKGQEKRQSIYANTSLLGKGHAFGERSLITNEVRSATVVTNSDICEVLCLKRGDFETILGSLEGLRERARWSHILMRVPQFASARISAEEKHALTSLDSNMITELEGVMKEVRFEAEEIIVRKGEVGDTFYIVKSGNVAVSHVNDTSLAFDVSDRILGPTDFFGERSLFGGDLRSATITAVGSDTVCRCLTREDAEHILSPLTSLLERARWRRVLLSMPIVIEADLVSHEIDMLVDSVVKHTYKEGDIVKECGDIRDRSIYLLNLGKIKIQYDNRDEIFSIGSYFGESVLKSGADINEEYDVIFLEDSVCGVLSVGRLRKMILRMSIKKTEAFNIKLESIAAFKTLGSGSFGKVFLVKLDSDPSFSALKVMSKRNIHNKKQTEFVLGECDILSKISHPLLMELSCSFQNDFSLFILTPFYSGGDLHSLLQSKDNSKLDLETATFYCACLLDGLAYMHSQNIIHRDIKSENVMIDSLGYLVIIDFGFAKRVEYKTFTVCGTPFYMAPETLLSKGYDKSVDYWAMGVVFYEMLIGYEPFYADDEMSLYREICTCRYYLPSASEGVDQSALHFIKHLFTRVQKRLGCLAEGVDQLRKHSLFKAIDWSEIRYKEIVAPSIPNEPVIHGKGEKLFTKPKPNSKKLSALDSMKFEKFGPFIDNPRDEDISTDMLVLPQAHVTSNPTERPKNKNELVASDHSSGCCIIS